MDTYVEMARSVDLPINPFWRATRVQEIAGKMTLNFLGAINPKRLPKTRWGLVGLAERCDRMSFLMLMPEGPVDEVRETMDREIIILEGEFYGKDI